MLPVHCWKLRTQTNHDESTQEPTTAAATLESTPRSLAHPFLFGCSSRSHALWAVEDYLGRSRTMNSPSVNHGGPPPQADSCIQFRKHFDLYTPRSSHADLMPPTVSYADDEHTAILLLLLGAPCPCPVLIQVKFVNPIPQAVPPAAALVYQRRLATAMMIDRVNSKAQTSTARSRWLKAVRRRDSSPYVVVPEMPLYSE